MTATQSNISNDPDWTLDVATLLREGTAAAHTEAENSSGAGWLTRGELDKEEYIRFLIILWHIYSTLEEGLEKHASHPAIAPTYNPTLLSRAPALASDIAHLLATPEAAWQSHPLALSIARSPPTPLSAYTARLRAAASDPPRLLAHAYVRYLGDLSGGQIIRRRIAKAYDLDPLTGLGTQFYEFQKLGGGGAAGIGDMRSIKVWYRDGMNKGVGDKQGKVAMVEEANVAFQLNGGILDILLPPSVPGLQPQAEVIPAEKTSGTVSVASVLSFLLAMGIAHFALVTGGFLGDAGIEKWDRAREWVGNAFGIPATA
ncbi:heme oxygenase-like protein [Ramaria rubella]|nr:heme oxygenase-like protein [Ramaria rubella]